MSDSDSASGSVSSSAPGSSGKILLDVKGLSFSHPGGPKVFDNLDLSVSSGETVVIMGGSGVGKTTLAELIFNLKDQSDYAGKIKLKKRAAALVLQEGAVFEHLTVGGNLVMVLRRHGISRDKATIKNSLDEVGLGSIEVRRRTATLSGGQKRRLALARALCSEPKLLYCDEPSAGLDLDSVLELGRLIRKVVRRKDRAAVVVTHDPLLAALTGDRVLLMEKGRLTELVSWPDSPDELSDGEITGRTKTVEDAAKGRLTQGISDQRTAKKGKARETLARFSPLKIGDYAIGTLQSIISLPSSLYHIRDFATVFTRAFRLSGTSGVPFFLLVGGILGATFIMILLGASILPARITLEKVGAVPLTAIAPPLAGFLFASRSGSAISSWLGSMGHSRQVDALRSLRVSPDSYLRAPCWLAMILAFFLASIALFTAMWAGAWIMVTYNVGIADASSYLRPFINSQITFHAKVKIPLYAVLCASITTHVGLRPKKTAEDVARGTTHVIIVGTVLVVLVELLFAAFLAAGG